jgi:hypothetical protein
MRNAGLIEVGTCGSGARGMHCQGNLDFLLYVSDGRMESRLREAMPFSIAAPSR